jgi:hypothetical protein
MALLNECLPLFEPGDRITGFASAAVVGKHLVSISGARQADGKPTVATCGAGLRPFGVAAFDQATVGGDVSLICRSKTVLPLTAGATVAAGVDLMSDATGRVITWTTGNIVVGQSLDAATVGNDVMTQLV